MLALRAPDMSRLHHQVCERLIRSDESLFDVITSVDIQVHNVMAEAKSMNWEYDLKYAWLTPHRWPMLVRQYIDPEELENWIGMSTSRIGLKNRGIAVLRTKTVKPRGGKTNQLTRRWGSCMLSLSYRAVPKPQIVLHSRTSYMGYLGALDMSVAWMCGRYLAKELGIQVEDMGFIWFNENVQWHNFKSLAYLLSNPDPALREEYRHLMLHRADELSIPERKLIMHSPGLRLSRKWLRKVLEDDEAGRTYGDMNYNTFRRIVRRYHTEVLGYETAKTYEGWSYYKQGERTGEPKEYHKAYTPLPNTPIFSLDFKCIGMPLSRSYGEPFIGGWDDSDEIDD